MKYSYMYVYTRMIFATVLSPAIKIFHRHLGPNLLIFAVKVSPWFHQHFTVILWHITAKKHRPRWFLAKTRCACCISFRFYFILFRLCCVSFRFLFYNHPVSINDNWQCEVSCMWLISLRLEFQRNFLSVLHEIIMWLVTKSMETNCSQCRNCLYS
jgi:hypothetical protein